MVALFAGAIATGAVLLKRIPAPEPGSEAASVYILGPARSLLSAGLYERADMYFHKGAPHHKEEAFHGVFQKWKEAIVPTLHAHAEGREIEEIMPWLRLATKSDPHNIEIYLVASYWLNGKSLRPDLAQQAIMEALENNPDRYELHMELGRLLLSENQFKAALESLDEALSLVSNLDQKDPEQAAIDFPFICILQSYLHEALGDREKAIVATKLALNLHPGQTMSERLEKLESQPLDADTAKNRLSELFQKNHPCDRDDHDHDEHDSYEEHVHGPECSH